MSSMFLRSPLVLAVAFALSACSLAPKYERPDSPVPAQFPLAQQGQADVAQVADLGWREFFTDARLHALIEQALENNRDLRIATQRIEEARAQYGVARSDQLPSIGVQAAQQATHTPAELRPAGPGSAPVSRTYQAGVGITAFELDFFGRVRDLARAAREQYFATEQAQRTAHIALVAGTAEAYFKVRAAEELHALMSNTLRSRQETLRLVQSSYDAGTVSALDLNQAKVQYNTVRSDMQAVERDRQRALNALQVLLGREIPQDLPAGLPFTRAQLMPSLPVGLSAELLERRPDILAAEHVLRGSNYSIGAARAAFFPRLSLTGLLGFMSPELGGLFSSGNRYWQFQPQVTMPLLSGSTWANLDLAEARRDIAISQYEKTIQVAFREVADALAGEATYGQQIDALQEVDQAASESLRLAKLRYEVGIDSFLQVQTAEVSLYGTRQAYIQTGLASLMNRVELYKALGGGWTAETIQPETKTQAAGTAPE